MKLQLAAFILTCPALALASSALSTMVIPSSSTASLPPSLHDIEAQAVLSSKAITDVVNTLIKNRHLSCIKESPADVTIQHSNQVDADSFEVNFGCNSLEDGINTQQIDFSGYVFPVLGSQSIAVNVKTIQVNE